MSNKEKKEKERLLRLSWFSPTPENDTLEKDGFVYFKHWDGNRQRWTVDKFTPLSYANMKGSRIRHLEKLEENRKMDLASKELENKYFID